MNILNTFLSDFFKSRNMRKNGNNLKINKNKNNNNNMNNNKIENTNSRNTGLLLENITQAKHLGNVLQKWPWAGQRRFF